MTVEELKVCLKPLPRSGYFTLALPTGWLTIRRFKLLCGRSKYAATFVSSEGLHSLYLDTFDDILQQAADYLTKRGY